MKRNYFKRTISCQNGTFMEVEILKKGTHKYRHYSYFGPKSREAILFQGVPSKKGVITKCNGNIANTSKNIYQVLTSIINISIQ